MKPFEIRGKHVLITGAGKRLGRAIADKLVPFGIQLTAHYQSSEKEALELVTSAEKSGGKGQALKTDLHSVSDVEALAKKAMAKFGPVDILVNSASIFFPTPLEKVTEAQWDEMMDVNLKAQFFLSRACGVVLKEKQRSGVIVNLVDANVRKTLPGYTPYMVSKSGFSMLTRNLARELAPWVRVNSISPGPVLLPEHYTDEQMKRSQGKTLLKRLGTPADIAEAALFLIGNQYMTGQDLPVDGGRSLVDNLFE